MADKFGRFLHDRRQIFVGRFYWQTKLANFIVRLTSALVVSSSVLMLHSHAYKQNALDQRSTDRAAIGQVCHSFRTVGIDENVHMGQELLQSVVR